MVSTFCPNIKSAPGGTQNQLLARELWTESACDSLPKVQVPVLVLIGEKNIQIDGHADGEPPQEAAGGIAHVTFDFPPNVNHVLKEELRDRTIDAASLSAAHNAADTRLNPRSLGDILDWLSKTLGACNQAASSAAPAGGR